MLVPTSRLLFWFACIALPFSILGMVLPGGLLPALVLTAGFGLVAAWDALRGMNSLDGVSVETPDVLRLSKGREGNLDVVVHNPRPGTRRVNLGFPWPEGIELDQQILTVDVPSSEEGLLMKWPFRPMRRGRFPMTHAHLEGFSPWGLWNLRQTLPSPSEFRVYPNLQSERRDLSGLFLNRGVMGLHAQRQVGKGREFEKLREYSPGDGIEDVHWKATAKRGHPVTKVFQIERTQELYVIVDTSRLSARRFTDTHVTPDRDKPPLTDEGVPMEEESTLERFLTAALVLGLAAERQGDHFGLITFGDKVDQFIRAKNGQAHYNAIRDALYTLQPQPVTPDFEELASFIRLRMRRRALLVMLTALDDPVLAEQFTRSMDLLCRQHLVLVNMITPPGAAPLFSRDDVRRVDDLYSRLGGHLHWHRLQELEGVLKRRGISFQLLEKEGLSTQLVSQYLNVKRRQLL